MRIYMIPFKGVSAASVLTFWQINGAAGKMLRIRRGIISATNTTPPTDQQVQIEGRFLPATVTNGSGGSSVTPAAEPGDAAASFAARCNDTTRATSNGTIVSSYQGGFNIRMGWGEDFLDDMWPLPPIGPSEAFCLD